MDHNARRTQRIETKGPSMNGKADAVRAISQQFRSRINEVVDGVMVHLTADNVKEILGPTLSPLLKHGSPRSIVTFAFYADVLRVVRDMTIVDGTISDEEVQEGLGMLSSLASSFAQARKEYAVYRDLSIDSARAFLGQYASDTGLFGYRNDTTRWAGRQICCRVEAHYKDAEPLTRLSDALFEWAQSLVMSDTVSQSEQSLLQALARVLNVSVPKPKPEELAPPPVALGAMDNAPPPQNRLGPVNLDRPQKACPYCGEMILAVAVKCKHCGEMLGQLETPQSPASSARDMPQPSRLASPDVVFPEIKRTCHKCEAVWYSDSKEEVELEASIQSSQTSSLLLKASGLLLGYGRAGDFNSADSQQRIQSDVKSDSSKLQALRRCPECNSKSYAEIRPHDPAPKPRVQASPQKIWGNVLIGTGSYGVLLGCAGDFGGGLTNVVFFFLGFAVVVAGLNLRND